MIFPTGYTYGSKFCNLNIYGFFYSTLTIVYFIGEGVLNNVLILQQNDCIMENINKPPRHMSKIAMRIGRRGR